MFDLTGKVAFVTGASSGIGRASAIALANQGAKVAIVARRMEKLQALAAEIKSRGKEALPIEMDVTKKEDITAAITKTVSTFGRLDILLNDAGALSYKPFLDVTDEEWNKVMETNLRGYFWVAQMAAKEMAKNKWGRIVNIASIAARIGFAQISHYCASKGGVVSLTQAMAIELAPLGILVNAIAPGGIATEMADASDPSMKQLFDARVPLKRIGQPEEIAAGVCFLASNEASYVTGSTLTIDGGWMAE